VTRLDRNLRKSPGEKSLGQTIGNARRDMNPFTARDADLDLMVLEGIPAVNFGRGVPDPTPGGAAAMSGPNRHWRVSEEKNPSDIRNPDGHFPREFGPMWKNFNFTALNVAPRARRGTSPASVNTYLHVEWTEPHWDAVRDDTGIWNPPPPPEMEVERAIYDAMKRETIEVGGYNVPFPKYPKESDYGQYTDPKGATIPYLRAPRSFPFSNRENSRWTDGDPLYHAAPTGLLPKIIAEGLVTGADRQLWFGASPTVWNEQFPGNAADRLKSPVKGMSFLRISPTDAMNERLSLLAKVGDVDRPTLYLAIDSAGNPIEPRDYRTQRAVGLYGDAIYFDDIKIPGENIEVLSQSGEWIPLYKTDLSEVVFDPSGGAEAGMSNEKNRGVRRLLAKLTNGRFGEDGGDDAPTGRPEPSPRENAPTVSASPVPPSRIRYSDSYGGDDLIKDEQRIERMKHEALVASGSWNKIHSDHYDWWAYPIDRGSASYGETFNVAGEPTERLKKDPEFLASLAREIEIQALALGWSLYDQDWVESLDWENGQDWRRAYPTRFWKATRSAQIFGLEEEFESLLVLKQSLEDAGIAFGREDYWRNPGTIDNVPSLGPSWEERRQTPRFGASDATGQYSLFPAESPFDRRGAASGPTSPEIARRKPETGNDPFADRPEEWPGLAYDSDDPSMQVVFGVVIAAEELADLLFESDRTMEFGYPYERIDEETRSMMAEDIFFATGLLDEDQLVSDFDVDRQESAAKMREYARAIWDSVGYADDAETLEELAEALEDPTILEDDLIYQPTDPDPGAPGAEAGMGRRFRDLDEEPDYSEMSLSDAEIQNFIESEFDLAEQDKIFGRSRSLLADLDQGSFVAGKPKQVYQLSIGAPENIPDQTKEDYKELWNAGVGWREINRRLGISNEDGALVQSELLRTGIISKRSAPEGTSRFPTKKSRPLTDTEERFAELLLANTTKRQIMDELGLSREQYMRTYLFLRGRGLQRGISSGLTPAGRPRRELSDIEKEFVRLYGEGKTMPQIMAELGLSRGQYINSYQFLRGRGLVNPRRDVVNPGGAEAGMVGGPRNSAAREELIKTFAEMYNNQVSKAEIMRRMGLTADEYESLYNALRSRRLRVPSARRDARLDSRLTESAEIFAEMYNGGASKTEIMREMDLTPNQYKRLFSASQTRALIGGRRDRKLTEVLGAEAGMSRTPERGDLVRIGRNSDNPDWMRTGMLGRVVGVGRDGTISAELEGELIKLIPGEDRFLVIPRQVDTLYELTDNDGNVMYLPVEDVTYPLITRRMQEAAKAGYRRTGIIRGNMRTFFDEATGTYKTSRIESGIINAENIAPETTAPVPYIPTDPSDGEAGMSGPDSVNLPDGIDEELKDYAYEDPLFGQSIKHPLFFWIAPITPEVTDFINASFAQKRASAEEALAKKNWGRYIYLHERPYRIDAFEDVMDEMTDQEYWSRLSNIWVDSENIGAQPDRWRDLLMSERGSRESFMNENERAELAKLPQKFTVYRGYSENDQEEFGMSWSTDAGVAEWFARRFARENEKIIMEEMEVSKDDVLAYLTRRGEEEIILDMRTAAGETASRRELPQKPKTRIPIRNRNLNPPDGEAGMSSALVRKVTDDDAQLGLIYAVPGVRASVVMRDTEGLPTVPGRNAIMKPYLLAPHVSLDRLAPDNPAIRSLAPALGRAGLGSYPVEGHKVPKIQGPVVRDFADELIGPKAVADAISGTFPTADEIVTIYAINALIRARAEYLSDSTLTADQVNTAILNGKQVGRSGDGGADAGGTFWTPPDGSGSSIIYRTGTEDSPTLGASLDPFMSFKGKTDFLWFVTDAMPETVKSELASYMTKKPLFGSWSDLSDFENINIRENDDLSRRFAPMVRAQARVVVEHARRHVDLAHKWARVAYETMRGAGLSDAEVAFVINEHWTKAAEFSLDNVEPGKVLAGAARLGAKAFSSRYSPITKLDGRGEEEDYGLHEFFHHYLGQGFTRHGEYVAFRGPVDLVDSYHGHLQWAFNQNNQLGMFATKVLLEGLGADTKNKLSKLNNYSNELFESVARAIYDRLREMLASPDVREKLLGQVFPEFAGTTTADEARIMDLIRKQFERRSLRPDVFLGDYVPAMRLMTAQDFLVPKEYWPYGGESKILFGGDE